ncbi:MAG: PA2778 family cysteine peptidase [Pseudoxanthomonas sp.]
MILHRRLYRAILAGATLIVLAGCAINPPLQLRGSVADAGIDLSRQVPFHPQTDYQCGPAALATVLGASGVEAVPENLASQVYLPGRRGSLQVELLGATRRAGRIPYPLAKTPEALFAELQAGHPVLVLQNLLTRSVPQWHYAVIVGADAQRNRVRLNSGKKRGMEISAPKFLRTWDWGGRWAMVALKPGELPVEAEAASYLTAVADFEAVAGAAAATPAYEAAQQRWPEEPRVFLALGNQAYATGDKRKAASLFRDGLGHAPGDPVLSNNYASAMGELGCRTQALRALDAATVESGTWRNQLAQTRAEVDAVKLGNAAECKKLALPAR